MWTTHKKCQKQKQKNDKIRENYAWLSTDEENVISFVLKDVTDGKT